jgi:hypothetical protein
MLGQLLQAGRLMLGATADGQHQVSSGLRREVLFSVSRDPENHKPSNHVEGCSPDFVAGARFPGTSTDDDSGFELDVRLD